MTKLVLVLAFMLTVSTGVAYTEDLSHDIKSKGTGILVVTYHTGRKGERLDRVRFRLINEQKEQTMYPRAGTFYDKAAANTRRVTIPDLAPGHYTIEFIAPNQDGLFGEIRSREVTIYSGDITKLDQALKPHYARVKATAVMPEPVSGVGPTLRLTDIHGSTLAVSHDGNLETNNLLPGQYTLSFDPYADLIPPDPINFQVAASTVVGPFERHYKRVGQEQTKTERKSLRVNRHQRESSPASIVPVVHGNTCTQSQETLLALGRNPIPTAALQDVVTQAAPTTPKPEIPPMLSLLHPHANRLVEITGRGPHDISLSEPTSAKSATLTVRADAPTGTIIGVSLLPENGGADVKLSLHAHNDKIEGTFHHLPGGNYRLSFELPSSYFDVSPQQIALEPGHTRTWTQPLTEVRAIRVHTNTDQAEYTLIDQATHRQWHASGRRYVFEGLQAGDYQITFAAPETSELTAPEPKIIQLAPDQDSFVNVVYTDGSSER